MFVYYLHTCLQSYKNHFIRFAPKILRLIFSKLRLKKTLETFFIVNVSRVYSFYIFAPDLQTLLKILEGSEHLFSRYGIKSITMDDVARELGMSKKTLYQYVSDKNDLVEKTLDFHLQRSKHTCQLLVEDQGNPIDAMLALGDFFCQHMKETNPSLMFDLRKYHAGAWQKLDEYRLDTIALQIRDNLIKGIREGYYREDINVDVIPRLYLGMVDAVLESRYFPRDLYKFEDVVQQMLLYHIHGISTQKGKEYLTNKNN